MMSKDKKQEEPGKSRNQVNITLTDEMLKQLEEERERRGGDRVGIKLPQIIREKLARQFEQERKKK